MSKSVTSGGITQKCSPVSLTAFTLLFNETVHICGRRGNDWDEELKVLGRPIGPRVLEMASSREKNQQRRLTAKDVMLFLQGPVWELLFGYPAELEQVTGEAYQYFLVDTKLLLSRYNRDSGCQNVNYFTAGVLEGALRAAGYGAMVRAYCMEEEGGITKFWVQFDDKVCEREKSFAVA
eukprot:PhF_6_TR28704/c0_g1_i1/m.42161/K20280/TRAPPC5, TRS31; trafficking protein particle complex subunit 5